MYCIAGNASTLTSAAISFQVLPPPMHFSHSGYSPADFSSLTHLLHLVFITDFFVISATFSPSSCLCSFRSLTINVLSLLSFAHLATKLKITQTIDAQIRPYLIDCFFVFFSLAVSHVEARPSVLDYLITVSICHYHHYCMYEHCKATIINKNNKIK